MSTKLSQHASILLLGPSGPTSPSAILVANMIDKKVSETHVQMAQVITPDQANIMGKMFGGALLAMIDLAAFASASRFAGNPCVTAGFHHVDFHDSILIGELVTLDAFVSYAGRTSVEVTVRVNAENIQTGERRQTNTAHVTMVAIKDGRPTPVRRLVCETREDKVRYLEGKLRREMRSVTNANQQRMRNRLVNATDEELEEMMASNSLLQPDSP